MGIEGKNWGNFWGWMGLVMRGKLNFVGGLVFDCVFNGKLMVGQKLRHSYFLFIKMKVKDLRKASYIFLSKVV